MSTINLPGLPISIPNLTVTQLSALVVPLVATIPILLYNSFPSPSVLTIRPSLGTLPVQRDESAARKRLRELYPEDIYEGGGYAKLPHGKLKYWIVGPENGVKVVLINGIAMPAPIWSQVVPYLTAAGYRVLLYDHHGRGYSEAPDVPYTDTFYATQLALLLQYVKWDKPNMIGLSMGGSVLAAFTAAFPHLVGDKIAFIASVGVLKDSDIPRGLRLAFSPLVQYLISTSVIKSALDSWIARTQSDPSPIGKLEELVRLQRIVLPGYVPSIASSMRQGPVRGQERAFSTVGSDPTRKILMIWGTADQDAPFRLSSELSMRMPRAKLTTIPDGGHDLTVEHPEQVGNVLVEFLAA